ncbi:protein of unknown function [Pseudarcicella hirudinis]|uniref:Ferric-dicitrate binding protein FerR, regulates iron transport through sigma-19 n=1 Tax=Pseudarcicella hirudinis TaxID=1079859 RepID=A0A1I5XFQ1_9BACT|nr:FecR family protein [Pseudarcicella hirudinis]SFQ30791.1 protein of unknown function [Pseudarcicella hirudinis]
MKKYLEYDIEDFVWDDYFRQWVLIPTRESDNFWKNWIVQYPEKAKLIEDARTLVKALKVNEQSLSDQEIQNVVRHTLELAEEKEAAENFEQPGFISINRKFWIQAAAAVAILVGLSWGVKTNFVPKNSVNVSYEKLVSNTSSLLTETLNEHENPLPVKLSDGSLVILTKGSRISYPKTFSGSKREVFLSGEAFFEVTKNPEKPFLVYANGLITKVLGTSFRVRAYESDKDVTVEVKTGRVSVFAQSDPKIKEKATNRELEGVVLTPNQKIIYAREDVRLTKSLVEAPVMIATEKSKQSFEFEDTPVSEVLLAIEKAYSVDIVFDEELLANCPLTASLTDLQLFEKLNIICKGVEARYEILDGQIVIYSKGCKQ